MNKTATRPSKKTKHKNWRNRVYNYLKENEMATSTKLLEEITVGPPPGSPTAAAQLLKRDSRFYSTMIQVLVQRGNYTQPRLIWGIKNEE